MGGSNDYASLDKKSHTIKGVLRMGADRKNHVVDVPRGPVFSETTTIFPSRTGRVRRGNTARQRTCKTATDQSSGTVGTYFSLLDSMFSSVIPDPVARAAYVNAVLLSNGISPSAALQGGFLTTGVTLQQRKELSLALVGVRNTVTFAATRGETQDISNGTGSGWFLGTDFSSLNNVKQTGASVNWSHKLSGLSSLTGSASRLKSKGRAIRPWRPTRRCVPSIS